MLLLSHHHSIYNPLQSNFIFHPIPSHPTPPLSHFFIQSFFTNFWASLYERECELHKLKTKTKTKTKIKTKTKAKTIIWQFSNKLNWIFTYCSSSFSNILIHFEFIYFPFIIRKIYFNFVGFFLFCLTLFCLSLSLLRYFYYY